MKQFIRFYAVGVLLLLLVVGTATAQEVMYSTGPAVLPASSGANGGFAWGDVNGDGTLDLFVPSNVVLLNNITSFAASSTRTANISYGSNDTGLLLADINGDGVLDLWSTRTNSPQQGLFYDSAGVFIAASGNLPALDGGGNTFYGMAVADIDHTNYLTAAWARYPGGGAPDGEVFAPGLGVTMVKNGPSGFTNIGTGAAPADLAIDTDLSFESWGVHFFDANNDGFPDLLMPSFRHAYSRLYNEVDSAGARKGAVLYLNDGTGKFDVPLAADLGATLYNMDSVVAGVSYGRAIGDSGIVVDDTVRHFNAIGSAWGELNNDGNQDVIFVGFSADNYNGNGSFVNVVILYGKGDGTFTYKWNGTDYVNHGLTQTNGTRAWDVGDYNNDGIPDLFGSPNFSSAQMWRGNGNGTFTNVSSQIYMTGGGARAGGFVDYNNDGAMDVYTRVGAGTSVLLKNSGNSNNWIAFTPVGTGNNKSAIGARFTVTTPDGNVQTRVIRAEGNANGGQTLRANFGIGINTSVTNVDVLWPDGTSASFGGLDVNRYWTVVYGSVNPAAPVLTTPADDAVGQAVTGTLDWNDAAGAVSYRVQVSMDPTFENDLLLAVDEEVSVSEFDYSLGDATEYFWRASAINEGFMSGYSAVSSFTTAGSAAAAVPVHVLPADAAMDQPAMQTLVVNNTADASRYQWQVSTLSTFNPLYADEVTADSAFSVQLVGGQTYYWRVRGINDLGQSAYSSEQAFTVMSPPARTTLLAPANSTVNVEVATVNFVWSAVGNAASYNLQVSNLSSTSTYTTADTAYTLNNLTRNANYTWKVEAINAGGTSFYTGNFSFTTVPAVPAAPALLSPGSAEIDVSVTPTFTWSPSVNASKYRVLIATDNQTNPGGDLINVVRDTTVIDTTFTLANALDNSSVYYWQARAENFGGAGTYSSVRLFETAAINDVEDIAEAPRQFALQQNYPNPFNPSTTISYDIPNRAHVSIKVYDLLGRVVATLVDEVQSINRHSVVWNAAGVSSGMYFYRIDARSEDGSGSFTATKKLVLMK